MRRKPVYTFLASLLLASVLAVTALCAEPELANGELRGDGVPEGWSVRSYLAEDYTLHAENGVVTLSSQDYNDLRLTQLVEAEPGTAYVLTAEVSAAGVADGRGACLSIDNFSVDGSYI